MTTQYVIAQYDGNWADEFDMEGFRICTQKEWDDYEAKVRAIDEYDWRTEHYFGTNEAQEFDDADSYFQEITVTKITEAEYTFLKKNFGEYYGMFIEIETEEY